MLFCLELTPQQIDHILHTIDSLDEDKLQEMHAEFLELWYVNRIARRPIKRANYPTFSILAPMGKCPEKSFRMLSETYMQGNDLNLR